MVLALIAIHAVNVPFWDEWDLLPFVLALRDGRVGWAELWAQHNEHRLTAVKLLIAPLIQVTAFDVRAMMYAGFALQLLAFAFLWRTLADTLPGKPRLVAALALAISLLMFSAAQDQNWLWGLTSVQWHLCNLAAAAAVWLLSRRPRAWYVLPACFLLTCAGMTAVASGIVLWGVVLLAIATEAIAARRWPSAWVLAGWGAGAVALALYFVGLRRTAVAPNPLDLLSHPRVFLGFLRVYLGWPMALGAEPRLAAAVGSAGLVGLAGAAYAAVFRGFMTERMLPWLWLSSHALLVGAATAVGRSQLGIFVATTNRYSTGALFFWIGLLVIAALTLGRLRESWSGPRLRMLTAAAVAAALVAGVNYVRFYRDGYRRFEQSRHDRRVGLAEVWQYGTAPDEAMTSLYGPSASHARAYARIMEVVGVGPFARHMAGVRRPLADAIATAVTVTAGEGNLDAAQCTIIAGWAWDRHQPDVPVKVEIYDGDQRLATVPAYWYRRDLEEAGLGQGRHAFLYMPAAGLKDGRTHLIRARIPGTGTDLNGGPMSFLCAEAAAAGGR